MIIRPTTNILTTKLFILFMLYASLSPVRLNAQAQGVASTLPASRAVRIPILIYHSIRPYYEGITNLVKEYTVPPEIFDEQMRYLVENGFTPVTFDDVFNQFTGTSPLPPKPVIITIDDGWANQYRYAFPILKKYKIPAVIYVYPGALDKKHFLTYSELKEMSAGGMIIGDHTQTHPELPSITDISVLNNEIAGSKRILEEKLGIIVKDFAYPFGEYNTQSIAVVKAAGYRSARTVHGGYVADPNSPFTIDGIIITGDFNRFVSKVNK